MEVTRRRTRTGGKKEGEERTWRRGSGRSTRIRRLKRCFNPVTNTAARRDPPLDRGTPAGISGSGKVPTHLVVMVNGIIGSAGNWRFAANQFVKRFPEDVVVQRSRCNSNFSTFDGVDVMGERLAEEVLSVARSLPELKRISFVAHSLGGLIARYAIARLYIDNNKRKAFEENGNYEGSEFETQCLEEKLSGTIAGLEPINFITFATPHLGSRWHKQIPILCGFHALEKGASHIAWICGKTGRHLFLNDNGDGKPPLLLQMVNDSGDLKFISALQSFRRRVAYSNSCSDHIVGWKTSSIRHENELPTRQQFSKNLKYPHVVHVEMPKTEDTCRPVLFVEKTEKNDMEEAMIQGLNRVTWERVDISFKKSIQRIFAHSTIQVKTYRINSHGADVICHMMDNFVL